MKISSIDKYNRMNYLQLNDVRKLNKNNMLKFKFDPKAISATVENKIDFDIKNGKPNFRIGLDIWV